MQQDRLYEKVLSRKTIYKGKILTVEEWEAELYGGKKAPREIVLHVGAAAVVPVDEKGIVTLVQQFRIPLGRVLTEIPAGKKDSPEEDPLLCAERELAEETGLRAESFRYLTTIDTSPGFLTERIGLYLATGLSQGETNPDEDEFLNVIRMPLKEAVAKVMAGEITDAKTICGLLMAAQVLADS